jgi:predicted MFS family arabinose efflux permease
VTIGRLVGAAVLMAVFVVIETRSRAPIMPFSIFRIRAVTGSNVAGFALGAAMFGMFFILTLYMQQVVQYSPLKTGLAYLAVSLAAFVASVAGSAIVTRIGPRTPMVAGLLTFAVGVLLLAQIPVDGTYVSDLMPGLLITGVGLGLAFVAFSIGALEGVAERDAGLASGLSNTSQQIGGALGVAIMSTLAISRTEDLLADGTAQPQALTEGFRVALYSGVALAVLGALAVLVLVRRRGGEASVGVVAEAATSEGSAG